jgi:predicted nucleic acid-binding protein
VTDYYIDTSVALHAILDSDARAGAWIAERAGGDLLVSSKLLRVEVARTLLRDGRDTTLGTPWLARIALVSVNDRVLRSAETLLDTAQRPVVRTLDAIHLAALLDADPELILVSHDEQQLAAARALGLRTLDPLA